MNEKTKNELLEIYNLLKNIEKRLATVANETTEEAESLFAIAYEIEGARGNLSEII